MNILFMCSVLVGMIFLFEIYGLIMSFTLLRMDKNGWWMLTAYIPWIFSIIFATIIMISITN